MYCPGCGRSIPEDVRFCPACGRPVGENVALIQPQGLMAKKRTSGSIIGIVIAVVVVIIAVLIVLSLAVPGLLGSSATVRINVNSLHILSTVSFNVYVDGSLVESGSVLPLSVASFDHVCKWSSSDSKTVMVSAESTGGILGSYSDQEAVTVSDGGYYTVSLSI